MKNYIGLNIKYLCDKNLLSQRDFGAIFNITQAVVNAYIKGKSNPQVETIQKICNHFEISIDDFISEDLSISSYQNKPQHTIATEPKTPYINDKDVTIAALRETIETQKELIATLRSRLDSTQTKAS